MKILSQYKGLGKGNFILFFGKIVTNLGAMIWPMMTLILNGKLGLDATQTALFFIITGFMFLPANIWGGQLADRFSKKKIIILCDIVSIVLFIISGFLPLTLYTLCVTLVGAFFQTLEGPAYQAMVAEITPLDKREQAFSLLYMGGNIGLILSPTIAGILFNNYLWLCFVISGVSISVSTVLIAVFIKDSKEIIRKESKEEGKEQDGNILVVIKSSATLILFLIAMSFYQGAYSQFSYLMPLDISKAYPENGSIIYGTVTSLNCIIVVVLTPVITMVMEKVPMTKKYLLGIILQALSFGAFALSYGVIAGYYVSITLFTLGEILTTIVTGAFLADRVSANYRGRIYGITSFSAAFMTGIVEWNSGWLFDYYGSAPAWIFSVAMTMIAVIASFVLIFTDKKEFGELYR
ncbi:Na+/melibiose symporter [Butyrivibrio sp. ob235]|uniref:MFS transporter n=1 Tax=Butyrivibrio sp. ob235 TaxID=1761780 RepID=UPI0008B1FB72|nr:MFS transporter [Butyrivibrio sp. ob235]SEL12882.1 Na+/melibiose symporter [Butyrivibrio sp. ob235]